MKAFQSGLYRKKRPEGANTFSFMWAYPNFIPLSPTILHTMWKRLKPFDFNAVHSLFVGRDVRGSNIKGEVLRDMKMQALFAGHQSHLLLGEVWEDTSEDSIVQEQTSGSVRQASFADLERKF